MLKFMHHEADILVSTTIIENGLDIPLVQHDPDQPRRPDGFVGALSVVWTGRRSSRRSYAYLLLPSEIELTPIAAAAVGGLKEFSDLGAGFKIAALDLNLRGSGNMLGANRKVGHIEAIGFELYNANAGRAVAEMKASCTRRGRYSLNLGLNIRIPSDYISERTSG